MTVYIQLIIAGVNTGPFDLYSDLDLVTPFASAVSKAILLGGADYNITFGASSITVVSRGACVNNIVLPIPTTSTTTSTSTSTTSTSTTSSTTTIFTTLFPCIEYCVNGFWEATDVNHIGGGTLLYIDCAGVEQGIGNIYIENPELHVFARSIVSHIGCSALIC